MEKLIQDICLDDVSDIKERIMNIQFLYLGPRLSRSHSLWAQFFCASFEIERQKGWKRVNWSPFPSYRPEQGYIWQTMNERVPLTSFPGGASGKEPACQCRRHSEMWIQSLGREDPLEESTATHSSTLPWRIPGTDQPGGLQSTGLQRVGQD